MSVAGLLPMRGPTGEIDQSDHVGDVEGGEAMSVDDTASLSSGDFSVQVVVAA